MDTLLLNFAYISYIAASLIPSGPKLRLALVAQSIVFIAWGIATSNRSVVAWNVVFAAINAYQALRLARRNAVKLTDHEEAVRTSIFPDLNRRDFLLMWSTGQDSSAPAGTRLCTEGTPNRYLHLLTGGDLSLTTESGLERTCSPTCFVGEMSFVSGAMASATVVADTPVQVRRWDQDDLRALQALHADCAKALHAAIALDIARKLHDETVVGTTGEFRALPE